MKNSLLFVIFILVTNTLLAGKPELIEKEYLEDNNSMAYAVQNVIDYTLLWQILILFFIFF